MKAALELQCYDRIEATFQPRRTDDLRNVSREAIGQRWLFDVDTEIVERAGFPPGHEYEGEWACWFVTNPGENAVTGWVPSGDLADIVLVRRLED